MPAVVVLVGTAWVAATSVWNLRTLDFSLWTPAASTPEAAGQAADQRRRTLIGGLAIAVAAPLPAFAYETYKDSNLGFEFKYPTGLQKTESSAYNLFLRDIIEPLESVGVKVTDTKRKSLDEIGDPETVAKLLMEDSIPKGAPRELIKVKSKTDGNGRRVDIVEYAYQWKFDPEMAKKVGKKRFQLHQKALITIDRKRQYVVFVGAEEERWLTSGEGDLASAIDTFTLTFN